MIKHYSPITELIKLQEDVNRLLDDLSGQITADTLQSAVIWIPNVDLSEDTQQFIVKAEVPGVTADQLQIVFQEGYLHLAGEKKQSVHQTPVRYICLERNYGKFHRTIYLNAAVDINGARAKLQNGVLTIVLPKLSNRRRLEKIIPIEVA